MPARDEREEWDDSGSGGTACACGRNCAECDYLGNPRFGPRAFCDTDRGYVGDAIRGLPELYAKLSLKLAKTGQQEERVSGSREAPVPVDLETETFMRHVVLVALTWEEIVRGVVPLSNPDLCTACDGAGIAGSRECPWCRGDGVIRARDGASLQRACELLGGYDRQRTRYLGTLLSLEPAEVVRPVPGSRLVRDFEPGTVIRIDSAGDAWERKERSGTDAGLEFLRLSGQARGMLGLNLQRRRITEVPCDGCGLRTLVQREALSGEWEPVARCTNCTHMYIGAQFELLMARVYRAQVDALNEAS